MPFKTFLRTLYAKLESTEGDVAIPNTASDAIEVIDPTYTISPRMFERNPTRLSISPTLMHSAGSGSTANNASSTMEFSFTVEMAGSGTAQTAPRWGRLLKACGFEAADGLADDDTTADSDRALLSAAITGNLTSGGSTPTFLFHKENVSNQAGTTYATGDRTGRIIGDTGYDDGTAYLIRAGATNTYTASDNLVGEVSTNYGAMASALGSNAGVAYFPTSNDKLGGANYSSLTLTLALDDGGSTVTMRGARGNVEFVFAAGDRVLMNFTFVGQFHAYTDTSSYGSAPTFEGRPIPPSFLGAELKMAKSQYGVADATATGDQIFSTMSINMNNNLVVREDAEQATGYDATYITGRAPSMTFNPDANTVASSYDYFGQFLGGLPTRTRLSWGSSAGNKFLFKMPALQFTGIADGNRDEVVVYDGTATLTGGGYGSSVSRAFDATDTSGDTAKDARMGTDNEIVIYQL